jgi:hypothetical protein
MRTGHAKTNFELPERINIYRRDKKRKLKNLQYPTPRVLAHSNVPYILGQIYHNQTFKNRTKKIKKY